MRAPTTRWRWPPRRWRSTSRPSCSSPWAASAPCTGPPPALDDWGRDALNRERGVGDFETLLQACVELGARFIVCEMGLRSLDIDRASLRTDVPFTIAGIVTLLEETKPGMHLLTL